MAERKAILITGGGSGIGRAIAERFARAGWLCGVADVNRAGAEETVVRLPSGAGRAFDLDVRDRAQWAQALAAFVGEAGGRLDVLANNAGIARGGPFETVLADDNDQLIDVNFKGVVNGVTVALPYLRATPGAVILNTASASALYGSAGLSVYSATKFAVRGLTEALDIEFQGLGVRVRSLMPGFINTPLLDIQVGGSNRIAREDVIESGLEFTPVEDVAEAAWAAVHGDKVHTLVGPTAKRLSLFARFAPGMVRGRMMKMAERRTVD